MKTRGLGEGLIEQRFRNAVIAHKIEADFGEGVAKFLSQNVKRARHARAQGCQIKNGNAVGHGE